MPRGRPAHGGSAPVPESPASAETRHPAARCTASRPTTGRQGADEADRPTDRRPLPNPCGCPLRRPHQHPHGREEPTAPRTHHPTPGPQGTSDADRPTPARGTPAAREAHTPQLRHERASRPTRAHGRQPPQHAPEPITAGHGATANRTPDRRGTSNTDRPPPVRSSASQDTPDPTHRVHHAPGQRPAHHPPQHPRTPAAHHCGPTTHSTRHTPDRQRGSDTEPPRAAQGTHARPFRHRHADGALRTGNRRATHHACPPAAARDGPAASGTDRNFLLSNRPTAR